MKYKALKTIEFESYVKDNLVIILSTTSKTNSTNSNIEIIACISVFLAFIIGGLLYFNKWDRVDVNILKIEKFTKNLDEKKEFQNQNQMEKPFVSTRTASILSTSTYSKADAAEYKRQMERLVQLLNKYRLIRPLLSLSSNALVRLLGEKYRLDFFTPNNLIGFHVEDEDDIEVRLEELKASLRRANPMDYRSPSDLIDLDAMNHLKFTRDHSSNNSGDSSPISRSLIEAVDVGGGGGGGASSSGGLLHGIHGLSQYDSIDNNDFDEITSVTSESKEGLLSLVSFTNVFKRQKKMSRAMLTRMLSTPLFNTGNGELEMVEGDPDDIYRLWQNVPSSEPFIAYNTAYSQLPGGDNNIPGSPALSSTESEVIDNDMDDIYQWLDGPAAKSFVTYNSAYLPNTDTSDTAPESPEQIVSQYRMSEMNPNESDSVSVSNSDNHSSDYNDNNSFLEHNPSYNINKGSYNNSSSNDNNNNNNNNNNSRSSNNNSSSNSNNNNSSSNNRNNNNNDSSSSSSDNNKNHDFDGNNDDVDNEYASSSDIYSTPLSSPLSLPSPISKLTPRHLFEMNSTSLSMSYELQSVLNSNSNYSEDNNTNCISSRDINNNHNHHHRNHYYYDGGSAGSQTRSTNTDTNSNTNDMSDSLPDTVRDVSKTFSTFESIMQKYSANTTISNMNENKNVKFGIHDAYTHADGYREREIVHYNAIYNFHTQTKYYMRPTQIHLEFMNQLFTSVKNSTAIKGISSKNNQKTMKEEQEIKSYLLRMINLALPNSLLKSNTTSSSPSRSPLRQLMTFIFNMHTYTRMFAYRSLRFSRTIRFLSLVCDILSVVMVNTLFFQYLYPNTDTVNDNDGNNSYYYCQSLSGSNQGLCEQNQQYPYGGDYYYQYLRYFWLSYGSTSSMCHWDPYDLSCTLSPLPAPPSDLQFYAIATCIVTITALLPQVLLRFVLEEICSKRPRLEDIWLSSSYLPSEFNVDEAVTYDDEVEVARVYDRDVRIKTRYAYIDILSIQEQSELIMTGLLTSFIDTLSFSPVPWDASYIQAPDISHLIHLLSNVGLHSNGLPITHGYMYELIYGDFKTRLERQLISSVASGKTLNKQLKRIHKKSSYRDLFLLQSFISEQFSTEKIFVLSRLNYAFQHDRYVLINGLQWLLGWLFVYSYVFFVFYWILLWTLTTSNLRNSSGSSSTTTSSTAIFQAWSIQLSLAIAQDIFLNQIVILYVIHTIASQSIRPQLQRIYDVLSELVMRTSNDIYSTSSTKYNTPQKTSRNDIYDDYDRSNGEGGSSTKSKGNGNNYDTDVVDDDNDIRLVQFVSGSCRVARTKDISYNSSSIQRNKRNKRNKGLLVSTPTGYCQYYYRYCVDYWHAITSTETRIDISSSSALDNGNNDDSNDSDDNVGVVGQRQEQKPATKAMVAGSLSGSISGTLDPTLSLSVDVDVDVMWMNMNLSHCSQGTVTTTRTTTNRNSPMNNNRNSTRLSPLSPSSPSPSRSRRRSSTAIRLSLIQSDHTSPGGTSYSDKDSERISGTPSAVSRNLAQDPVGMGQMSLSLQQQSLAKVWFARKLADSHIHVDLTNALDIYYYLDNDNKGYLNLNDFRGLALWYLDVLKPDVEHTSSEIHEVIQLFSKQLLKINENLNRIEFEVFDVWYKHLINQLRESPNANGFVRNYAIVI
eukprot:gene8911-18441_t